MVSTGKYLSDALNATATNGSQSGYGKPLINFLRISVRWSNYLQKVITPLDVAFMMVDLKIARQINQHKDDNIVDMLGYLFCINDMDNQLKDMGYEGLVVFYNMSVSGMQALIAEIERDNYK